MFIITIFVCVFTFNAVKRKNKIISLLFIFLGLILMIYEGAGYQDFVNGWISNAPLICFLLTIPLFSIPMHYEPYQEALLNAAMPKFTNNPFSFYAVCTILVTCLASLLNIASQVFVHNLMKGLAGNYPEGILTKAFSRGFVVNMFWSPSYMSVAIVMHYVNISWIKFVPTGFIITVVTIIIAMVIGRIEYGRCSKMEENPAATVVTPQNKGNTLLAKLLLQMGILITIIVVFQFCSGKSALVIVPAVALTGPFLLAVLFGKTDVFWTKIKEFFLNVLPKQYNEIVLFSAFGVAGYALSMSEAKTYIPLVIDYLGIHSHWILIPVIIIFVAVPCLFGLHPIVPISSIAIALPLSSTQLSDIQMTGALLTGYLTYTCLSPFSASSMLIMSLTKENALDMFIKQNWKYALAVSCAVTVILMLCKV